MKCPYCQSETPDKSIYCRYCGKKTESYILKRNDSIADYSNGVKSHQDRNIQEVWRKDDRILNADIECEKRVYDGNVVSAGTSSPKKRLLRIVVLLGIAVGLVFVVAAGVFVGKMNKNRNKDAEQQLTGADISDPECNVQEKKNNTNDSNQVRTDSEKIQTEVGKDKSLVQKAIENRKFYFVSPQTSIVDEYCFLDDGEVEFKEYTDKYGEILDSESKKTYTYRIKDADNAIILIESNDGNTRETIFYYIEEYDYFRTDVHPSDSSDPTGMPPEYWAYGFFPFEYKGNSGEMNKYWCDVLAPTFYSEYLDKNREEKTETVNSNNPGKSDDTSYNEYKVQAMYASIVDYVRDGGLPDGNTDMGYGSHDEASEYAVLDIDNDGKNEILIKIVGRSKSMSSLYIYECNPVSGKARLELMCDGDVDFMDDGRLVAYSPNALDYDQNSCAVYEYDSDKDYYVEAGTTSRDKMGDKTKEGIDWYNVNDNVLDSEVYALMIKNNITNSIGNNDIDIFFKVLERRSIYEAIQFFKTTGKPEIVMAPTEYEDSLEYYGYVNGQEVLDICSEEGGWIDYHSCQMEYVSIAGIYPGMDSDTAHIILDNIDFIHADGTNTYYSNYYGKNAFHITVYEENGKISRIVLSDTYYLKWYMQYDDSGFRR